MLRDPINGSFSGEQFANGSSQTGEGYLSRDLATAEDEEL
jgi:hypothetical protein